MNRFTLLTFGSIVSMLLSGQANAERWNQMNNPNNFNIDWHPTRYEFQLDRLPTEGAVPQQQTPWADSYWPKNRGAFTYRWYDFQASGKDQMLTTADRQRLFFNLNFYSLNELRRMSQDQIARLSPLEKYSIYIGDYRYSLVKKYQRKNSPDDAYWEGYCHAWAGASAHYAEPLPTTVTNGDGISIPFGSGDIKALLVANYADLKWGRNPFEGGQKVQLRYVGQLCKKPFIPVTTKIRQGKEVMTDYGDTDGLLDSDFEKYVAEFQVKANRVKGTPINSGLARELREAAEDPGCNDTNAGSFHIVMSNQLGLMKEGFLMDKTRDAEIWNQPVYKFESKITGYETPGRRNVPGTAKVAVVETNLSYADDTDYGWTFWNPTLAGLFNLTDYFKGFLEEYKVYQDTLIKEGDETEHSAYPEHVIGVAHYKYTLELDSYNRIIGGNWISFDRPDDLYIMKKVGFVGDFSELGRIYRPITSMLGR